LGVQFFNAAGTLLDQDWGWSALSGSWQQYSKSFKTTPAGTVKVRLLESFDTAGANWLDDCAYTAGWAQAMLANPGFENDPNGQWPTGWGVTGEVETQTAVVHSGSKAAVVYDGNTSAYQEFHSAPGEVWGASAWAQRNNYDDDDYDYGDGNLYLNITYLNGDGGVISYDSSGARPLWQDWQHLSRTFPAAPAGTVKVQIGFYFDNSGKNYLDDCAIVAPVPGVTARGTPWAQTYVYDGFGNMTDKISDHSVMTVAMDPATNRIVGEAYDANGNMLGPTVTYVRNGQQITGPANTWDAENRLVFQVLDGKQYEYVYDPWGRRVVKHQTSPSVGWETTFYGAAGERVTWGGPNGYPYYAPFAGQMVRLDSTQREVKDRLGSVRALDNGQQYRYLPYGEEEGSPTPDGRVKFATYERDSTASAQDYAGQRYYSNVTGRFFSPDPGGLRTANPRDPGSWNRYAYVGGDPVNFADPSGKDRLLTACGWPILGYEAPYLGGYECYYVNITESASLLAPVAPAEPMQAAANVGPGNPNPLLPVSDLMGFDEAFDTAAAALRESDCAGLFGLTPGSMDPVALLAGVYKISAGFRASRSCGRLCRWCSV
jgi:RHS repeat-associated protein